MNTHVRDNLNETSAATVTTAGDLTYADAANSMGSRLAIGSATTRLVSTGSAPVWRSSSFDYESGSTTETATSWEDLAGDNYWYGFGATLQVSLTTGTAAVVFISAQLANSTGGASTIMGYRVSGASTVAAADYRSIRYESSNANDVARFGAAYLHTGLTAGTNTFIPQGQVTAGTGTMAVAQIGVLAL
jgi:hypothetical protein